MLPSFTSHTTFAFILSLSLIHNHPHPPTQAIQLHPSHTTLLPLSVTHTPFSPSSHTVLLISPSWTTIHPYSLHTCFPFTPYTTNPTILFVLPQSPSALLFTLCDEGNYIYLVQHSVTRWSHKYIYICIKNLFRQQLLCMSQLTNQFTYFPTTQGRRRRRQVCASLHTIGVKKRCLYKVNVM